MPCKVLTCNNLRSSLGLCIRHYRRFHRYGTTELTTWYKNTGCKIQECKENHYGLGYCKKHYLKFESNPKFSPKRMVFRNKSISLAENPRKGICSKCKRTVKSGAIKFTQLHHEQYDESNPLLHTVELCPSCHTKESWRLNQIRKENS